MLNDPIADMLTRIRNAALQKHRYVDVRASKLITSILSVMKETGFVLDFVNNENQKDIRVFLRYHLNKFSLIQGLKRVSSPGRRIYIGWQDVPVVQNGLGLAVVSTSKGVMSGQKAKNEKIGGEFICTIW
ncbi:MAG: 30S ribosomal protein S8 [Chlamydiae bacterium]|jgi:small subunit ribosomal protein S8|nr:30S ribosomal protein S8 [Chlamydiota bacterium]